jgi:hypothetical protein
LKAVLGCEIADLLDGLDGGTPADAGATVARRLSWAVLAIDDSAVQEGLARE